MENAGRASPAEFARRLLEETRRSCGAAALKDRLTPLVEDLRAALVLLSE